MPSTPLNIQLTIREVYAACCPACQAKIRQLVKDKISDQAVDQVVGPDPEKGGH